MSNLLMDKSNKMQKAEKELALFIAELGKKNGFVTLELQVLLSNINSNMLNSMMEQFVKSLENGKL